MSAEITKYSQIPTLYDQYSTYKKIFSRISVWKGDITRLEIQGIVNPTNTTYNGERDGCAEGGVNQAIHAAAGLGELQRECRKRRSPTGAAYNIIVTPRCQMKHIRRIIHAIGPRCAGKLPSDEEIELLRNCYKTALWQLTNLDLHTIAFCPISTGPYGYPNDDAAYTAGNAVIDFLKNNPRGSWIHRVIFCVALPEDEKFYSEYFHKLAEKYEHTRVTKVEDIPTIYPRYNFCKHIFNKISIWTGDITKLEVDVLVCPTNEGLHGGADEVGVAIHEAAGLSEIKNHCDKRLLNCGEVGEIAFTPSFNMDHVKEIAHAVGPKCEGPEPTEKEIDLLKSCYRHVCIMSCHKLYSTIAFCPISTGSYGYPNDDAAYTAANAVVTFLRTSINANIIKKIVFCVPKPEDQVYYYEYFEELSEKYKTNA